MRALLTALAAVTAITGSGIGAPPAVVGSAAVRGTGAVPAVRSAGEPQGAVRVGRLASPASPAYNPVTGNAGFTVFVQGNAALNASVITGPVAVGGNLTFGSGTFNVATQTAGSFTASGDAQPTGLLVGGSVNWASVPSSGTLGVQSNSYVKIGNMVGSAVLQSGPTAPTHIVPTGHTYSSSPQIAEVVNQPTSSVNQSGLVSFSSAFSTFSAESADLASCSNSLVLTNASGTPLTFPLSPGTNAYITLTAGTQNILNISAANLANISILAFRNTPTATMPLIINVNTSGVGGSFSWTPPNINGFGGSGANNLMWNFSGATQLTVGGSQTIPGTIYAPGAAVTDNDSNGFNGGVIAAAYTQGGPSGSPTGGQVVSAPFTAALSSCVTPALTISLAADTATAAPGGTVHYTITATNSGSVAYTGATFTDALSDVLDDASYNSDATATAGSVSFTSPNLTWTGNLATGAIATITFSVTVKNPDTGNKSLASTISSSTTGSNCASGSIDSRCSNTVQVSSLAIVSTVSTGTTTTPGATVGYTITVTNSGGAAISGATFTDALSDVLDDASYDNNAAATAGSVSFTSPNLTWTGNLAAGAIATITFSVTVKNPDTGNKSLASTITSSTAGSNCASGSTDPQCTSTVTVLVPGLTIAQSASPGSTTPGGKVTYTITATNSGQTAYTGATITDPLTGLLDDASYGGDATASTGAVSFTSPNLTWTGDLAAGATVTVTFSVTVNNPDTGEKLMQNTVTSTAAGSNCAARQH